MQRTCDRCGAPFEARRGNARFCSDACRTSAKRARQAGQSEALTAEVTELRERLVEGAGLAASTRAELDRAGRLDTWQGQAALALAVLIDNATAVMGYAALVREHRAAMVEALHDSEAGAGDALDAIQEAALRILHGA